MSEKNADGKEESTKLEAKKDEKIPYKVKAGAFLTTAAGL